MINQIDPSQIDISVGAAKYFKTLKESGSIKYTSTIIHFNGFVTPHVILSKDDLPEIKGIIPPDPNQKQVEIISWLRVYQTCPIKRAFQDDHWRDPTRFVVKKNTQMVTI